MWPHGLLDLLIGTWFNSQYWPASVALEVLGRHRVKPVRETERDSKRVSKRNRARKRQTVREPERDRQ